MQNVKKYYVCNTETGVIKTKLSRLVQLTLNDNERVVQADDLKIEHHYFDTTKGKIVERHHFEVGTWMVDEYRVPLPVGTLLLWQGAKYTVNDGQAEVLVDQPGQHKMTLIHPHYHTEVRTIENSNAD